MNEKNIKLILKNKKAYFNYEIVDELEVGISLVGTEVKSIREGRISFSDSYIMIRNGSLVLINFLIQPYSHGGKTFNHESGRERILLAHKQEIKRLRRKVEERGFTLVPLEIYFKSNLVKIKIALAKGKATYNKKEAIKERDLNRDAKRELKNLNY